MKKILYAAFILVIALSLQVNAQDNSKSQSKKQSVTTVQAKDKAAKADTKVFNKFCPVSGEDLENNDVIYAYNGKTYGLCCKKCLAKFQKDPAKYAVRLNEDGTKFTKK